MDQKETKSSFEKLNLSKNLLATLKEIGFEKPSTIQEKAIPHILGGRDIIAQAKTGSGKTAAFGLPSLQLIEKKSGINLLVITPTRELCQQVCEELNRLAARNKFEALAIYGGQSISVQAKKLRQGVQALVATPGRLLDFLKSKRLKDFSPSLLVLDEADEMLDMGFLEDIQEIISHLKGERQTLLFSATMPKPIQNLANKVLKDPVTINVTKGQKSHADIKEIYYLAKEKEKELALVRLFDSHRPFKSIIFCKTKRDVDRLFSTLSSLGYAIRSLHGDMAQRERQQAIEAFRSDECKILVATDVAGRGLDVPDISHVFNFHLPFSVDAYTHRIGRTGRAGKKGTAISLLSPSEFRKMSQMLRSTNRKVEVTPLPTLSELKEQQEQELLQKVIFQEEHSSCKELLNQLQGEMDIYQIGLNLLSILLKEKELTGPESLGIKLEEVKQESRQKRRRGKERFRSKPMRNRSNGSNKNREGRPWKKRKAAKKVSHSSR